MPLGIESSTAREVNLIPPVNPADLGKLSAEETAEQENERRSPYAFPQRTSIEDQVAQLARDYGYDEETARQVAGLTAQPQQQEVPTADNTQQTPQTVPQPQEAPQLDDSLKSTPEYEAFNNQLKQYFGITGDDLKAGIEEMREYRTQQATQKVEQEINTLKQEWGDSYDATMQAVNERFLAMPANMQEALNNVQGARLLYAQIQLEQQQQGKAPQFDRPSLTGPAQSNKFQFTQSQLDKMPEAEYRKNNDAIAYAYANGLVDMSR